MTRWPLGTFWRVALAVACALTLANAGCRSCAEEHRAAVDAGPAPPTMPVGMLMPVDAAATAADAGTGMGPGAMRVARGMKSGAWTELQLARPGDTPDRTDFQHWQGDSSFVSLDAMTLLHEAFARALPGFDLFLPRLFAGDALVRLAVELDAFAPRAANADLATTAREVAQLARGAADKGQSLWVLGP